MAYVALDKVACDKVGQEALQLVQVELLVPLCQRVEQQVEVDLACGVCASLQIGSRFDRIRDPLDKVLQRDHPQPFYHGEHATLDVLVLVRRDSCLEVGHLALQASLRDLDVLPQLVSFQQHL